MVRAAPGRARDPGERAGLVVELEPVVWRPAFVGSDWNCIQTRNRSPGSSAP